MVNAYAPKLITPNKALATVMSVGTGKLLKTLRNLALGRMIIGVIVSPAESTHPRTGTSLGSVLFSVAIPGTHVMCCLRMAFWGQFLDDSSR